MDAGSTDPKLAGDEDGGERRSPAPLLPFPRFRNLRVQGIKKTARGFRNAEHFKTAIYFHCGGLDLYPHETG